VAGAGQLLRKRVFFYTRAETISCNYERIKLVPCLRGNRKAIPNGVDSINA
jgi:hypothetical protein